MQIVVPMAGAGRRFADAGYSVPKPLIPIDGVPMVVRAVRELPSPNRYVFVCHPEHLNQYPLRETLTDAFPNSVIVPTPGLTEGQACSVRLACPELDPDDSVLVMACDNTHVYDAARFTQQTQTLEIDCLIWTYRRDPRVLINPRWYGWVRLGDDVRVTGVSVKVPLSETPMNDQAITGCFWFRTARLMTEGIDRLIQANERVNGEFYLDSVPNGLIQAGHGVAAFEVEKYIGWGTPDDLEDYLRWRRHFVASRAA